jgi:hypothetical protein
VGGNGYTRIAKALNADMVPTPRPQQGRPAGWHNSVYEVLHRPLYHGDVIWNRTRKRDKWGQHRQSARPEQEWLRRHMPELQIVPDALWTAAQDRLRTVRAALVTMGRRQTRDVESRYLMTGFARCAVCGGGIGAMTRSHGKKARVPFYGCVVYQKRGTTVCPNGLVVPMERINEAVLASLGGDVLKPAIVEAVIAGVKAALRPREDHARLRRSELAAVKVEIARLTEAIATTRTSVPSLLEALEARQRRHDELVGLVDVDAPKRHQFDAVGIETAVRQKLHAWTASLTRQTADGRELLRQVLQGPLRFTPEGKAYRIDGTAALGKLLVGVVPTDMASPAGFEPAVSALKGQRVGPATPWGRS